MRMHLQSAVGIGLCLLTLVSGCVVVNEKPRTGLTRNPIPKTALPAGPAVRAGEAGSGPLASGPIAAPARAAEVADARVVVSVVPVGRVPFDGMTLPLVSPDGRFIASQTGPAPTWEAILADPAAAVLSGTTISAFAIIERPKASGGTNERSGPSIQAIAWPTPRTAGLLLGRSCDNGGFLVESQRPGNPGARWIGRVDWVTGELSWLVQNDRINAFATLGPAGELIYSRFNTDRRAFDLVIRPIAAVPDNEVVVSPPGGESLVFPLCSLDRRHVFAIEVPPGAGASLGVTAITLTSTTQRPGKVVARQTLGVEASLAAAFQCVAPMQTPWVAPTESAIVGMLTEGVALVSARTRSVVWMDPSRGLSSLAPSSASAVPLATSDAGVQRAGLLLATGKELQFQAVDDSPSALGVQWSRGVSVLAGPSIPRSLDRPRDGRSVFLLLEPTKLDQIPSNGAWLMVWLMQPLPSDAP